jgi:hypothetical protein
MYYQFLIGKSKSCYSPQTFKHNAFYRNGHCTTKSEPFKHAFTLHCMTHQCGLVVQILSFLTLVAKIEGLFVFMYTYYNQTPKRHLEHIKLIKII